MDIEIIVPLIGALASMAAGGLTSTKFVQGFLQRYSGQVGATEQTYAERLSSLTQSLTQSTKQVDAILAELSSEAAHRESAVKALEASLKDLEDREKGLQERIEHLQKVPLPAVEHFAKLMEPGDKRSAWRDYILFGAGVIVSTAISIGLKVSGWG